MSLELKPNDLTAVDTVAEDKKIDTTLESPAEVSSGKYPTGFCTSPESCKAKVNEIIGLLFMLLLLYYCVTYFPLLFPYAKGIFKMLKYFILYGLIMSTILLFMSLLGYLFWWFVLFYWAVERMIDPLKDNTVSSWYYYLSDNINWIIYYPAMIWFFLCIVGLILLLVLMILPAVSIVGFLIGYLFSMMGEAPCDKPDLLSRVLSGTVARVPALARVFRKTPSVMGKAPSLTPPIAIKPITIKPPSIPIVPKPPMSIIPTVLPIKPA